MSEEIKNQVRDEAKQTIRQSLDMTQEALQREVQNAVYRRQHGDGTSIDVQNAIQRLEEFQSTRAMKEVEAIRKIDSGEADRTNE